MRNEILTLQDAFVQVFERSDVLVLEMMAHFASGPPTLLPRPGPGA